MLSDTDYLFSSSFLRAGEGLGTSAERLTRMLEAPSPQQLYQTVADIFQTPLPTPGEAVFDRAFHDAVERVRTAVPDFSVFYPLLYKYDCTNIKTAVKCAAMGYRSYDRFYTCGTIPPAQIQECLQKDVFHGLPRAMGEAAAAVRLEYAKTGEARCIDLSLDRACFADMEESAKAGGIPLMMQIVSMRADFVNISACLRIRQSGMPPEAAWTLLLRAFVPGGQVDRAALYSEETGCKDIAQIYESLEDGDVKKAVRRALGKEPGRVEKIFDDALLLACLPYRFKAFGPEVVIRYLLIREAELMNGRLLAARFTSSKDDDKIRERLREVHV